MEIGVVSKRSPLAIFILVTFWCWFFLSLNPLDIGLPVGQYNNKRIMQLILICIFTLLVCIRAYRVALPRVPQNKLLLTAWVLSLLLVFLSTVFSANIYHSLIESLHWLLLASIFCCGIYVACMGLSRLLLLGLLVLHGLVVLKALLFLGYEVAVGGSLRAEMLYPSVEHHRFFNQVQVFVVPLLFLWAARTDFRKFAYFFLFINILLAFCGGARGLLVGLIAATFLAYLLMKPWRPQILTAAVIGVLAFFVYLILALIVDAGHGSDVFRAHTSGRSIIWRGLIDALSPAHFFIGEGSGAYSYHSLGRKEGHPHNSLLQLIFEWGGVATIAMFSLLLLILLLSWRAICGPNIIGQERDISAAILTAVVSAIIYSLFSGIVVMPIPQTLLFFFLGMLWGKALQSGNQGLNLDGRTISRTTVIDVASILTCWVGVTVILLLYVTLCSAYFVQQSFDPNEFRAPRFWAEGEQFRGTIY